MLFVFYGNDVVEVRKAASAFVREYEAKGYVVEQITPEEYEEGALADRAGARSLFSEEQLTIIDTPSENTLMFDAVLEHASALGKSENIFVLIEGVLTAPQKKVLAKYATNMREAKAAKAHTFNIFSMTDALLRRDKKSLWVLLQRAWQSGASGEEVAGILYWQVKMLMLAERTKTAEEAGQKPFVYTKAKKALENKKIEMPEDLSRQLLSIYHDAHFGKRNIELALERFVLKI